VKRQVFVAAGGGGDVIAAAMLAARGELNGPVNVATFSWDRLIVDPLPGPRSVDEFVGLVRLADGVHQVMPTSRTRAPAGSTLPRLAGAMSARIFLLDANDGAVGLGRQLAGIARYVGADELTLVDVGGDVVAAGNEPGLRSPLADTLCLAGCLRSGVPASVVVCGPGLDGELDEATVLARWRTLGSRALPALTEAHVKEFLPILDWHPSEATGLLIRAAIGARGTVEVRDAGILVALSEHSASIGILDASRVADGSSLFAPLADSASLSEANERLRAVRGTTELDYERTKALRGTESVVPDDARAALAVVDRLTEQARQRGVDYLTVRRLIELAGCRGTGVEVLAGLLKECRPEQYNPPLWSVVR
jgi:hypothetical protein